MEKILDQYKCTAMPSLNRSTSHSGRDGRPPPSSKDRLCSAVTTSGPEFEIGSPRMATDMPHIVSPSAPARGGQAAVSGGMGCCRRLWLRLATLIFPNRTCRSLGTSFASAGLFAPVLDKTHDISTTSRSRVISTHSGEVPLSYGTGF